MKLFEVICNAVDWPVSTAIFSTREKAERAIEAYIGGYILDCIRDDNKADALAFIEDLVYNKDEDTDDNFGWFSRGNHEDIYIEEKDLDEDVVS